MRTLFISYDILEKSLNQELEKRDEKLVRSRDIDRYERSA